RPSGRPAQQLAGNLPTPKQAKPSQILRVPTDTQRQSRVGDKPRQSLFSHVIALVNAVYWSTSTAQNAVAFPLVASLTISKDPPMAGYLLCDQVPILAFGAITKFRLPVDSGFSDFELCTRSQ
uniref:Uncharacterized protein n=2 Tax=Gibberella zeae (strain ATCC MYA-4620 / CBS 123657 / FGSC 9075 / NRRL 31084 / PH-1) TaxID=229533 RepID=A0A098E3U9_GIBZE